MENKEIKYYTPKIEELFVGYKCQKECLDEDLNDFYEDYILQFEYVWLEIPENYNERLRTKYLDTSDIESLNWIEDNYIKGTEIVYTFIKGDMFLNFWVGEIPYIEIGSDGHDTAYSGRCNSINELLTIQRLLEIE